jgi:hypothetical protein
MTLVSIELLSGCHFGHHCCRRMSPILIKRRGWSILINFYINLINLLQSFHSSLRKICARPPTPPAVWHHQIHAAGGVSGSITMVMVFVRSFVLFVWCHNLLYVDEYHQITLRWHYGHYLVYHPCVHHTLCNTYGIKH